VRVAIERPDGLLIERLLDAGLMVVAVHPNQVVAMRPRYSVAGGKSDGFDSFVLAELARTDSHRFRVLEPDGDQTKALRSFTRAREGLVRTRVGLANQLRDQLACFWPGATNVFSSVDSQIALAFLRRYPSPQDARGLGEQRLDAFLKRHGYPGRKPAGELLNLKPPIGCVGESGSRRIGRVTVCLAVCCARGGGDRRLGVGAGAFRQGVRAAVTVPGPAAGRLVLVVPGGLVRSGRGARGSCRGRW
jgi:Transposase